LFFPIQLRHWSFDYGRRKYELADLGFWTADIASTQLEQSKKLAESLAKIWSDLLSFAAKRRQAEAEFVQSLAHCDGVADLFKRQSEFFQASWSAYSSELPRALGFPAKDAT